MRKPYDPLAVIPPAEAIRDRLTETLTLAERLRVLLDVAERLELPLSTASDLVSPAPNPSKGGISRVSRILEKGDDGAEGGRHPG